MCASARRGSQHSAEDAEHPQTPSAGVDVVLDYVYPNNTHHTDLEEVYPEEISDHPQYTATGRLLDDRLDMLDCRDGIESGAWDWHVVGRQEKVLRTDKPIRMRVRWDCHRCKVPMDKDKRCPDCHHSRCPMCPRNPPVQPEKERRSYLESRDQPAGGEAPIIADIDWNGMGVCLNRPSAAGGQELVHRPPRQRVRRTCHYCDDTFMPGNKTCESCGHVRCSDCPRDPSRREKYPFGYPGDEFGPSSLPVYECIQCQELYPLGTQHGTPCESCGCIMSPSSQRARPRAVLPRADPNLIEVIQSRINAVAAA